MTERGPGTRPERIRSPVLTRRSDKVEDGPLEELNSKDLSKHELARYLFFPFLRYMYVVACVFLDILALPFLYEIIPQVKEAIGTSGNLVGNLVLYYFFVLEAVLIMLAIYYETVLYQRKFSKQVEAQAYYQALSRKNGRQ
ncbi:MAG: hypothetical protein M1151_07870 [Candidatus Thermoplasmatota archaeon]|jgi:hypothetical protein|nr:hypothetical protein [Candidatus Thermoplasmatota archaeon]MCL5786562.1 hypothetical protein [Candidatus Thermoplasmatota archaeon]